MPAEHTGTALVIITPLKIQAQPNFAMFPWANRDLWPGTLKAQHWVSVKHPVLLLLPVHNALRALHELHGYTHLQWSIGALLFIQRAVMQERPPLSLIKQFETAPQRAQKEVDKIPLATHPVHAQKPRRRCQTPPEDPIPSLAKLHLLKATCEGETSDSKCSVGFVLKRSRYKLAGGVARRHNNFERCLDPRHHSVVYCTASSWREVACHGLHRSEAQSERCPDPRLSIHPQRSGPRQMLSIPVPKSAYLRTSKGRYGTSFNDYRMSEGRLWGRGGHGRAEGGLSERQRVC